MVDVQGICPVDRKKAFLASSDKCPWVRRGEGDVQCSADSPFFSESSSDTALYHAGPAIQSTELWPGVTCHIRTTVCESSALHRSMLFSFPFFFSFYKWLHAKYVHVVVCVFICVCVFACTFPLVLVFRDHRNEKYGCVST